MPMSVGVAHSDYSNAQVAEATDVELLGPGDKIQQEMARRSIRRITSLNTFANSNETEMQGVSATGGPIIRTKVKFTIQSGRTLTIWVKNRSGSALTTGSVLTFSGHIYGRWLV